MGRKKQLITLIGASIVIASFLLLFSHSRERVESVQKSSAYLKTDQKKKKRDLLGKKLPQRKPIFLKPPKKKEEDPKEIKEKWSIRVLSSSNRAISGSTVSLLSFDSNFAEEKTDRDGRAYFTIPKTTEISTIKVQSEGYATLFEQTKKAQFGYVIHLNREGTIQGFISSPLGIPLSGMRVFAFPRNYPSLIFSSLRELWALSSHSTNQNQAESPIKRFSRMFPHATSDKSGYFKIRGVDPLTPYFLYGGGDGWALVDDVPKTVRSGSTPIRLEFWKLYGGISKAFFRDHSIPPGIPGSRIYEGNYEGCLLASRLGYQPRDVTFPSPALALSGLPYPKGGFSDGFLDWRTNYCFLGLKDGKIPSITLPVCFKIPGLKDETIQLRLVPLKNTLPKPQKIFFTKTVPGFGNAILSFKHSINPAACGLTTNHGPSLASFRARLVFLSQTKSPSFKKYIRKLWGSPYKVSGIPYGEYHVRLDLMTGPNLFPLEGKRVTIGPHPTKLSWDLHKAAGVLFDPEKARSGEMEIQYRDLFGKRKKSLRITGPPFYVYPLWESNFDFKIKFINLGRGPSETLKGISLTAGKVLKVPCFK
ncbi:MAG TPA: carboxypeptidase regulatory-like domain-containing protein [Planctomycetes bacterium]|nr:carboxypeptidase regulatory-like domain-containing protein [Planctomycetota bacterium]